jgi:hypothetical protein
MTEEEIYYQVLNFKEYNILTINNSKMLLNIFDKYFKINFQ